MESIKAPVEVVTKKGPTRKASVLLVDETGRSVSGTFWGESAARTERMLDGRPIACKGARVTDYDGLTLNLSYAIVSDGSELSESSLLIDWYSTRDSSSQSIPIGCSQPNQFSLRTRIEPFKSNKTMEKDDDEEVFIKIPSSVKRLRVLKGGVEVRNQ